MRGGQALASYTYDAFGQRMLKIYSGTSGEIYQYGQNGMLLEETDQSIEKDLFELKYNTVDGTYVNYFGLAALLAHVTVTPASQSGSGSNPPLTATATLTSPPTGAEGYDWQITGGNGAIVFPNGQEAISSTTNSITVEEPNPTGASVPFNVQVGVRYPTAIAAATGPSNSDALLYGPANDVFCGTPTITSISPNIWFSGQSYNITIGGSGFNPTASQSCAQSNVMISMANGGKVLTCSPKTAHSGVRFSYSEVERKYFEEQAHRSPDDCGSQADGDRSAARGCGSRYWQIDCNFVESFNVASFGRVSNDSRLRPNLDRQYSAFVRYIRAMRSILSREA
jgi:hypothetical protein